MGKDSKQSLNLCLKNLENLHLSMDRPVVRCTSAEELSEPGRKDGGELDLTIR